MIFFSFFFFFENIFDSIFFKKNKIYKMYRVFII